MSWLRPGLDKSYYCIKFRTTGMKNIVVSLIVVSLIPLLIEKLFRIDKLEVFH